MFSSVENRVARIGVTAAAAAISIAVGTAAQIRCCLAFTRERVSRYMLAGSSRASAYTLFL